MWPGYATAGPGDADRAAPGNQVGKGVRSVRELASAAQRSEPWSLPVILLIIIIRKMAGDVANQAAEPISSEKGPVNCLYAGDIRHIEATRKVLCWSAKIESPFQIPSV